MNKLQKQYTGLNLRIIQDWENSEQKIIQGHYDRKISSFFEAEDKNVQFQNLHKLIVKWSVLCGVKPLPLDEEIRLFVEYIAEHFYRLSLLEIDNAFNLATSGTLNVNAEHYQSFNVIYISKIINAYKDYKGKFILEYQELIEKTEEKEPTEEERHELMLNAILDGFDKYKEEKYYNDFGYITYDFLDKLEVIQLDTPTKNQILQEARVKCEMEIKERGQKESDFQEKQKISTLLREVMTNESGGHPEIVRVCKNLGLVRFYDIILENNLSLNELILKSFDN